MGDVIVFDGVNFEGYCTERLKYNSHFRRQIFELQQGTGDQYLGQFKQR
jgi:hypothetical protein